MNERNASSASATFERTRHNRLDRSAYRRGLGLSREFFASLLALLGIAAVAVGADDTLSSAKAALARGNADQAVALAKRAIAATPQNPICFTTLAAAYDAMGEYGKAVAAYGQAIGLAPDLVAAYENRGEDQFRLCRFKESVADFDKVVELQPAKEPYHWRRGISLYYNGEYPRAAKQFELHKKVNPDDVENAAWHYLCVAKVSGVDQARKSLIPIQRDGRVPFMEIYAMFSGELSPADVEKAALAGNPAEDELGERLFYAHLYSSLFEEAEGNHDAARRHLGRALEQMADVGYMGDVARAQDQMFKAAQKGN